MNWFYTRNQVQTDRFIIYFSIPSLTINQSVDLICIPVSHSLLHPIVDNQSISHPYLLPIVDPPVPLAPMEASRESRPGNLPEEPRFGKTNFFALKMRKSQMRKSQMRTSQMRKSYMRSIRNSYGHWAEKRCYGNVPFTWTAACSWGISATSIRRPQNLRKFDSAKKENEKSLN